jgi:outer membrane receptor for ferrienterochelin and colicins
MMVYQRNTFAVAFALFSTTTALAQQGVVTGQVTDAVNNVPLVGAEVAVHLPSGGAIRKVNTDEQGRYRLAVPAGTYDIVAQRVGYSPQSIPAVTVAAGATVETNLALGERVQLLQAIDVTSSPTSRAPGASLGTLGNANPVVLETRVPATPLDYIQGEIGFDFPKAGVQAGNPVFRGFNNVFSGSLLMINDYRFAGVPSLRVNTPYLIATPNEDVANVQFLLGPASALYGPNATSGVVHIISKSPFELEGTTVSIGGGERSTLRAGVRHSGASGQFGYKLSGMILRANDWEYIDPAETLPRDFDIDRWSGEVRADYRPTDQSSLILQVGRAQAGTALEMTGIGTAQAKDWSNTYYQARFDWSRLFVQAFLNQSHTDNTRLLRTQQLIIDKSRVIAAQARHGFNLGSRQDFAYGADFQFTEPRTEGTINGRNEDDDEITEYGAFLQSETQLLPALDLIVSIRGDKNSRLDDPEFSPRAALVFKPQPEHSVRLTFNSAFATPTPNNLFLDIVAQRLSPQLPYFIRTLGVPEEGFRFRRDCPTGKGGFCMRSPFAVPPGTQVVPFMPADVTLLWPVVRQLLAARGIDTTGLGTPTSAQIPTRFRIVTAPNDTVAPSQIRDVERLKANLVRTYEAGYTGRLANRVQLMADVYYETRRNFTGPLIIETPNAFFDPTGLVTYLVSRGRPLAQAQAIAAVIAPIPFGTVTPDNRLTQNADLMLTYRNFGKLKRWGADVGFEALLTSPLIGAESSNQWTLFGSYSWVNKDLFPRSEVGGVSDVTLNAPRNKASLGLRFSQAPNGLSVDVRGRWADEFPMNSGVFIGTVDSYTVVDATLAYRLPFAKSTIFSVDATNIFNEKHRELVGAPEIGRLVLTQLQVTF